MNREKIATVKKIIFYTYFTNFNISDINHALSFQRTDDFIEHYLKKRRERNEVIPDNFVETARMSSRECFEEMVYLGISFVSRYDPLYPDILKDIYQSPPMLYLRGDLRQTTNVAVVGTRVVSKFAESTVKKFVSGLPKDTGIVSGLALGIDTIAHNAALEEKLYTIAILPNSLGHIYPKENYELANRILEQGGALLSELPVGLNRGKKSFVERNRLQSGLSKYVFPVELGIKSGTMHTADFCIRQKRILLLENIDEQRLKLAQYEGVNYLRGKRYEKTIILNENLQIPMVNDSKNSDNGYSLFNQPV